MSGLEEVLPKAGLVYSEKGNLSELLCKPKLLPIKSATLVALEEVQANFRPSFHCFLFGDSAFYSVRKRQQN